MQSLMCHAEELGITFPITGGPMGVLAERKCMMCPERTNELRMDATSGHKTSQTKHTNNIMLIFHLNLLLGTPLGCGPGRQSQKQTLARYINI